MTGVVDAAAPQSPSGSLASAEAPFLTLVLPAFNEEAHLERCVRSLLDDPYPRERMEIFIVDGGSSDRTRPVAMRLAREFPFLRLLHNPRRLQAVACNLALAAADKRAEYIMRCDVHAEYPPGFLSRATAALERSGASVATYGDAPRAEGCFQAAVAFAQSTPLGVGDAWYRLGGVSRFVEHGKHGCFRRAALEAAGGYDEAFSHNEDSELSLRLIRAGGSIWLDAGLTVYYYPRSRPGALLRQYFMYGRGRARTVLKHRLVPRARQLAPVFLLFGEAACFAASPLFRVSLLLPGIYAAALLLAACYGAARDRRLCILLAPVAFAAMHHAWGAGFLFHLAEHALEQRARRRRGMASTAAE